MEAVGEYARRMAHQRRHRFDYSGRSERDSAHDDGFHSIAIVVGARLRVSVSSAHFANCPVGSARTPRFGYVSRSR